MVNRKSTNSDFATAESLSVSDVNALADVVAEVRSDYDKTNQEWHGYRNLRVWQKSIDLTIECYRLTDSLPKEETYGLKSQIRRASVSIANNIAEGWGRNTQPEFARFIDISLGSLCELETSLQVAVRLNQLPAECLESIDEQCSHLGRMLHNLRKKLRS